MTRGQAGCGQDGGWLDEGIRVELPGWWEPAAAEDVRAVSHQIGRPARGVLAVAVRCRFGRPMVTVVAPVLWGDVRPDHGRPARPPEPFPTTFWLTCPYLVAEVSALESTGWIGRLEQEVGRQGPLAEELMQAHWEAARVRRALASPRALQELGRRSPLAVRRLLESGVAGIHHPLGIKCLHAHLAHHLALSGNPVGRRVVGLLLERGVALAGAAGCSCQEL